MLDVRWVAEHLDEARAQLARRSSATAALLDDVAPALERRRALIRETEALQAKRNAANEEMSKLAKTDKAAFEQRRDEMKKLGADVKALEEKLTAIEAEVADGLLAIPNVPHATTPDGASADDNPVRKVWGEPPKQDFTPLPHYEI